MHDPDVPVEALTLIELVAGAIRDELGGEIDAYPGLREPERADPMNRAFRAVARAILSYAANAGTPARIVSAALRLAAQRRLTAEGWDDDQVRQLIHQEPGGPDDWLAFLLLSSRKQLEPPLGRDEPLDT